MDRSRKDTVRILNCEIQQLGQMIQVLSYEFTILQDFVKENYGPQYELFRKEHSKKQTDTANSVGKNVRVSDKIQIKTFSPDAENTSNCSGDDASPNKIAKLETSPDDLSSSEVLEMGAEVFANEVEYGDTVNSDNGEDNEIEGTVKAKKKATGAPRDKIWKKFNVQRLANGKIRAFCRKCGDAVSAKAERLRTHCKKCPSVFGIATPGMSDSELKSKALALIRETKTQSPSSSEAIMGSSSLNIKDNDNAGVPSRGRKIDPIWEYYNITCDLAGKKSAMCKNCNLEVSCKAERLRKHFVLCKELDKELDKGASTSDKQGDQS